ncbi:MAG TPA: hypothetical protein VFI30_01690 [Nocardioidaceae bacterium]|nr:hypothetical protein [Nocardioidaceae bacterium]
MAEIEVEPDKVIVRLTSAEKIEALHGDVSVPRSAVVRAITVPDGMTEVHGLKMPGTGLPGVILVGTWRGLEGTTFAVCHGERPAVVIELSGTHFDRIVATVDDPEKVVQELR